MDNPLTQYGKKKVEATLRLLSRKFEEALEKEQLGPDALQKQSDVEMLIYVKDLTSWLRREHLEYDDLSNIFKRLEKSEVIVSYGYAAGDYDDELKPYFKHGYFNLTLPRDFEDRREKYLGSPDDIGEETRTKSERPQRQFVPVPPSPANHPHGGVFFEVGGHMTNHGVIQVLKDAVVSIAVAGDYMSNENTKIVQGEDPPRVSFVARIWKWFLDHIVAGIITGIAVAGIVYLIGWHT